MPLKPGDTIGILGGGQLGRMLAMAAARLGFRTLVLDPDPAAPAAQTANRHVVASYADEAALADLAAACDVITYEFENIPVDTAAFLARLKPVHPPVAALEASQDRLSEKRFIEGLGIATAPFFDIAKFEDLESALAQSGGKGILKTRRMGYDGKGQFLIETPSSALQAWEAIGHQGVILEGFVEFDLEISVVAARGADGSFRAYEPAMNRHSGGILRTSTVPAPLPGEILATAVEMAERIASALGYVGVIGVEFFVTPGHGLIVNEIAPRVHNSGHWTEAACAISQFEQHIRAVAGLPLGETTRHSDCVMENLIGADIEKVPAILAEGNAVLHLYGKAEARMGRKMGHVTRTGFPAARE
ncbi:MAG TPA: 5-(carboxyamino)imidazole ribonucleotide synthase [Rhizobiaceae bacterium]|nr:5-(carboxyamino)imidazole ribonucleotide synthase [Rhizobiaceae bacterium]